MPIQNGFGVGWLGEDHVFLACQSLSWIVTILGSNVSGHLLLWSTEHVSILALIPRAYNEDMAFEVFACPLFKCLARHSCQSIPAMTSTATGTSSTCPAMPSAAGIVSLTHVEWNLPDSLFVGPLWILFLRRSPDRASLQTLVVCRMCWKNSTTLCLFVVNGSVGWATLPGDCVIIILAFTSFTVFYLSFYKLWGKTKNMEECRTKLDGLRPSFLSQNSLRILIPETCVSQNVLFRYTPTQMREFSVPRSDQKLKKDGNFLARYLF